MFTALANTGLIATQAQQICKSLQINLSAAEAFYQWLSAQSNADFAALPSPLSQADVDMLRSAFADLHALYLLSYGQPAPDSYGITGTYPFNVNVKEVVGP
jgi:hypothetical protein